MRRETKDNELNDAVATADALFSLGLREAQLIASEFSNASRSQFASGLCASVLQFVWKRRQKTSGHNWELRKCPAPALEKFYGLIERLGETFLVLPASLPSAE